MPGIVVFRRRWSVGSDDLVIPGLTLFTIHFIWLVVLSVTLIIHPLQERRNFTTVNEELSNVTQWQNDSLTMEMATPENCQISLHFLLCGHVALLAGSVLLEAAMAVIALKGSIMNTEPRAPMQFILYIHLVALLAEVVWLILSILWLHDHYATCQTTSGSPKESLLGVVITELVVMFSVLTTIWCTFDAAGRSWVKMKRFQRSLQDDEAKFHYKRSGSHRPNWRQRKVLRAYENSWNNRCRMLFCCMGSSDRYQDSFTDIARLLSDFFRDLDVVPSDVVAGLVLLRREQRLKQEALAHQHGDGIYEFLSGVPVTPRTRFVALTEPQEQDAFRKTLHFMRYALAAYGWPMFVMQNTCSFCKLYPHFKWCSCCCRGQVEPLQVIGDSCGCNQAALHQVCQDGDYELLYASFHVDVAETPFFIAIDYEQHNIVVSIRGTLSMKDVITDLNAEGEVLPLDPSRDDFIGHKGMVQAAIYIRDKLAQEDLIRKAQAHNPERGTDQFDLVLVGHSLGAGTAAILAIMLRSSHRNLTCYAYSPPGGLLSLAAMEYTKSFVTSVVVGKDVVPRLGLHQLETLRSDLMYAITKCTQSKWKTIGSSVICCSNTSQQAVEKKNAEMANLAVSKAANSSEANLAQPKHPPMYPPGRIMHVVRQHPRREQQKYDGKRWRMRRYEPVYQAIWAENTDFNEVLISPVMIQDHMPDKVLRALQKVAAQNGPAKPQRVQSLHFLETLAPSGPITDSERSCLLNTPTGRGSTQAPPSQVHFATSPHRLYLETSFTSADHSPTVSNRLASLIVSNSSSSSSGAGSKFPDLNPTNQRTTVPLYSRPPLMNLPANLGWDYVSILGDELKKTPTEANWYTQGLDNFPDEYSLLAPLATPETLSDVSSTCSRRSFALSPPQLRDLHTNRGAKASDRRWRHRSLQNGSSSPRLNPITLDLPSRQRASRHYSLLSGDSAMSFFDASTATETSSGYCHTPVLKTSPPILESPARLRMTREIMDLYHDAAADVLFSSPSATPLTARKLAHQSGPPRQTTSSSSSTSSLAVISPVTASLVPNSSQNVAPPAAPGTETTYRSPGPPPPLNTAL